MSITTMLPPEHNGNHEASKLHNSDDWPIPKHAAQAKWDEDAITPAPYAAESSQAAARRWSNQTNQSKASSSLRSAHEGTLQPEKEKKKRSSFKNFLTLKEPSQIALEEFARQQRKLAAERGTDLESASIPGVSSAKLPPNVPKVNSKWDGMPESAKKDKTDKASKRTSVSSRTRSQHSDRSSGRSSGSASASKSNTGRIAASPARSSLSPTGTSHGGHQIDRKISKVGSSIEMQPTRRESQIAPWSEPQFDPTLHIAPFVDPAQGGREPTTSPVPEDDRLQDETAVLPEISFFFPNADEIPSAGVAPSAPSIAESENDAIPPNIQRTRSPKPSKSPFTFASPKSSPLSKLVIRSSASKSPSRSSQMRPSNSGNTHRSDSRLTSSSTQAVRHTSRDSPTKGAKQNEPPGTPMTGASAPPIPEKRRLPLQGFLAGEAQSIQLYSDEEEDVNEDSEGEGDITPTRPLDPEPSIKTTPPGGDLSHPDPSLSTFDFAFSRKSTETERRPTTQDSRYTSSIMSARRYARPETADDGASVLSEQWFKTPQERLGLGGIIRKTHPSEEMEVPDFLSGEDLGKNGMDKKKKKRWSILKG